MNIPKDEIVKLVDKLNILCNVTIKKSLPNIGSESCSSLWEVLQDINKTLGEFIVNVGDGAEIVKGYNEETHEWEIKSITGCDSIDVTEEEDTINICINQEWFEDQLRPIVNLIEQAVNLSITLDNKIRDEFCCLIEECKPDIQLQENLTGCSRVPDEYIEWTEGSEKDGYYVETYMDVNPKSCTYGTKEVKRISSKDGQCEGVGKPPRWEPRGHMCSNLEAYVKLVDVEPESKTYGSTKRGDRLPDLDGECEPGPAPTGTGERCADFRVEVGIQSSAIIDGWTEPNNLPDDWIFNEGCITVPKTVDSDMSRTFESSVDVEILDPTNKGWEVKDGNTILRRGTGNFTGTFTTKIYVKYFEGQYLEGTKWVLK